jgi:peptide/nickel transport system ATP-binding protein
MDDSLLKISHLRLAYAHGEDQMAILNDVSLNIPRLGIVSLLGPSGCGKTQLARAILRLYDPSHTIIDGQIIWCDGSTCTEISTLGEIELNGFRGNKIGMVFQDPKQAFDPIKKCGDQVREALLIHIKVNKTDAKKQVLALLSELNLEDVESMYNAYPHQLSGGQLQRMAIAAAIIHKPALIIADEATSAIDTDNEVQIIDILKSYVSRYHSTLLWISHDLSLSMGMSDYIYIMDKGSIVDEGSLHVIKSSNHSLTRAMLAARYNRIEKPSLHQIELLSLASISKNYGYKLILYNFSMTIHYRQRLGVSGPSGKGKSTIAKIISNIETADTGTIIWKDSSGKIIDAANNKVQMVFQQPSNSFNPKMTMEQSMQEAISLSKSSNADLNALLHKVRLTQDILPLHPHQLSGGQLQRLAIARALLFEPLLLILDEAVTALDSITKKQILDLLDELHTASNMAYLFISHDGELIEEFCDRVIVL